MEEQLYSICINFNYDETESHRKCLFSKVKHSTKRCVSAFGSSIIFAKNKEDAIEIFKELYSTKHDIEFYKSRREYTNLEITFPVYRFPVEDYSFNSLQKVLKAKEFLRYCKNELGIEQTITNIINN